MVFRMSKLNEIQQALTEIEGGRFQKVGDVYLLKSKGYKLFETRGSTLGKDKTRAGTPDTIFQDTNGQFVFVQYTTESNRLYAKLIDDLAYCQDEAKTGIDNESVAGVILIHNSRSSSVTFEEKTALTTKAESTNWSLEIIDIEKFSIDLWDQFRGITEEFLGINVDTGQILESSEFVRQFNRGNPTSPLDIDFHFREQELEQALQQLEIGNLLIISGPAGVGKTRFALECCHQFVAQHPTYHFRCILNKSVPIYRDIKVELSPAGDHLLLIDDINRLTERDYIINMLREERSDRRIKLVLTVRDYAIGSVQDLAHNLGAPSPLELASFTSDQIRKLMVNEFGIHKPSYLDRIAFIAKGNARLSVMAACIAVQHNTLLSIADASGLYEEYFSAFQRDGHLLSDRQHLRVAGIVAFFRSLDRTNSEYMQLIYNAFALSEESFWDSVYRLHEAEVLDVYEREVVKISDQVFATYLIYKVFLREHLIDLAVPLVAFYFHRPRAAADAIYPVLNTFQNPSVLEGVKAAVEKVWPLFLRDPDAALQFLAVFWFVRPEESLSFIYESILAGEEVQLTPDQYCFDPQKNTSQDPILEVLRAFINAQPEHFKLALQLILEWAKRRHDLLPAIVSTVVNDFGFHFDSYLNGYGKQAIVVEAIRQSVEQSATTVKVGIFLHLAENYLRTHFSSGYSEGNTYFLRDFRLDLRGQLPALRQNLWQLLFKLAAEEEHAANVLGLMHKYARDRQLVHTPAIVELDASYILPFLSTELSAQVYNHCWLMRDYLNLLDDAGVLYDSALRSQYLHPAFEIAEILIPDLRERIGHTHEAYEEQRREHLSKLASKLTLADLPLFLEHCLAIIETADTHHAFQLRTNVAQLWWIMAEIRPHDYSPFLQAYLMSDDQLDLQPLGIIFKLLQNISVEESFGVIRSLPTEIQQKWLFALYAQLPASDVQSTHVTELLALYATAPLAVIPGFRFLIHYTAHAPDMFVRVTEAILARSDFRQAAHLLQTLLPYEEAEFEQIVHAFRHHVPVLAEVYLLVRSEVEWADYGARTLNLLLDLDPSFADRYIAWLFQKQSGRIYYSDHYDHSNLWLRPDHAEVMQRILCAILQQPQVGYLEPYDCFKSFFVPPNPDHKRDALIEENIFAFLVHFVEKYADDSELMTVVFEIVAEILPDRRKELLTHYLQHNQDPDKFRTLSFFQSEWTAWGSVVLVFEAKISFLQSLFPLLTDLRFMRHRRYVEEQIRSWQAQIDRELRRQFAETDW